jgi:hypothetical protein
MRKADLKKIIKTMDEEMQREEVPPGIRPMQVLLRLSERLRTRITSRPEDEIYNVVMKWYERKYGNKLKADRNLGVIAVLIRNDLFKMTIPLLYGEAQIVVDPNVETKTRVQKSTGSDPAVIYVLNCIEGLTIARARELSPIELKELILYFSWGCGAFQSMQLFTGSPYIHEALGDLGRAVDHLFSLPQLCGQSKWTSLQATEKFMKAYIAEKGGSVDGGHALLPLAEDAYALGLRKLNPDNLEIIQCAPGVRFGESAVDVREAVETHHASIDICATIASSARRPYTQSGSAGRGIAPLPSGMRK